MCRDFDSSAQGFLPSPYCSATITGNNIIAGYDIHSNRNPSFDPIPALESFPTRRLLDHGHEVFFFVDTDLHVQYVNEAVTDVLGLIVEETVNIRIDSIVHPDDAAAFSESMSTLLAHPDSSLTFEVRLRHAGSHWLWMKFRGTNLLDDPNFLSLVLSGHDITEQKRLVQAMRYLEETVEALRESESRYRLLAMTVTDMISRHSPDGRFTFVTPSAREILGYAPDELLGHSNYGLLHPDDQHIINEIWHRVLHAPHVHTATYRMRHKNGEYLWLETTTHLIRDPHTDEPMEIIAVARDISARVAAEDKLREALQKEQELSELKSRFISIASHEFRTPLSVILASTDTLTGYRSRMDESQIEARLDRIRQQVTHLNGIVDEVLQLGGPQRGLNQFVPTDGDLDALVREMVDDFASRAETRQRIRYTRGESPFICAFDSRLMRQIISNLISNAMKYSEASTTIEVDLEHSAGDIILRVHDRGIGIPADDLKYLYQPFHRSSNVGSIPGTGLGLNITYMAVERHNGSIHFDSMVGEGTTVTVTFPAIRS